MGIPFPSSPKETAKKKKGEKGSGGWGGWVASCRCSNLHQKEIHSGLVSRVFAEDGSKKKQREQREEKERESSRPPPLLLSPLPRLCQLGSPPQKRRRSAVAVMWVELERLSR